MMALANTLDAKDPYTHGHSQRVSELAVRLAEFKMGVSPEVKTIGLAGQLHDIGKIGVSDLILSKTSKLSETEFNQIKEHTTLGEKILNPISSLKTVSIIIRNHHERYDGTGYPNGLTRDKIPTGSRILALADSYDAMTSNRPYRASLTSEEASNQIKSNLGSQFDPEWGNIFLELYRSGSIG